MSMSHGQQVWRNQAANA